MVTAPERHAVLDVLHRAPFVDLAPKALYATLLDEGVHLCSWRTMYRILEQAGEVRERRAQRRYPAYTKPELLATGPNQVWSWDITKLRGPVKWTYFYLYVILDIFSRYVVGWMVAEGESATLAERLIEATCAKAGHHGGPADDSRRSGDSHDREVGGPVAGRPGRDAHALPSARLGPQPIRGGAIQDVEVSPDIPGARRLPPGRSGIRPGLFPWYNTAHRHDASAC
jgi:putative transposase